MSTEEVGKWLSDWAKSNDLSHSSERGGIPPEIKWGFDEAAKDYEQREAVRKAMEARPLPNEAGPGISRQPGQGEKVRPGYAGPDPVRGEPNRSVAAVNIVIPDPRGPCVPVAEFMAPYRHEVPRSPACTEAIATVNKFQQWIDYDRATHGPNLTTNLTKLAGANTVMNDKCKAAGK